MAGKAKISYFYDPDVGNFYYGQVRRDRRTHAAAARVQKHPRTQKKRPTHSRVARATQFFVFFEGIAERFVVAAVSRLTESPPPLFPVPRRSAGPPDEAAPRADDPQPAAALRHLQGDGGKRTRHHPSRPLKRINPATRQKEKSESEKNARGRRCVCFWGRGRDWECVGSRALQPRWASPALTRLGTARLGVCPPPIHPSFRRSAFCLPQQHTHTFKNQKAVNPQLSLTIHPVRCSRCSAPRWRRRRT
jgi:hypothetical protein